MMTKCWNCKNSTGNCPWSRCLKPVKGWNAISTKIYGGSRDTEPYFYDSYVVKSCPLFQKDKLTISDICRILNISIRTYYRWKKDETLYKKLKEVNITKMDIISWRDV